MQTLDTWYNYSIVEMKDVKIGLLHYFTDKYLTKEVISNYITNLQFGVNEQMYTHWLVWLSCTNHAVIFKAPCPFNSCD